MNELTGSAFVRDTHHQAPDGRRVVMMLVVAAVPEDFELKGEHMYTITGDASGSLLVQPDGEGT